MQILYVLSTGAAYGTRHMIIIPMVEIYLYLKSCLVWWKNDAINLGNIYNKLFKEDITLIAFFAWFHNILIVCINVVNTRKSSPA